MASVTTETGWRRQAAWHGYLVRIAARINDANHAPLRDQAARCLRLFEALNLCCTAFGTAQADGKAGDTYALVVLLAEGIEERNQARLCRSPHVARLGGLQGAIRKERPADAGRGPSPESLAQLLSGARQAIAEGKRVPQASDRGEAGRRTEAAPITAQVLNDIFEALFDFPSRRLAVYGTLAPGERHHDVMAGIPGSWTEGTVDGVVNTVAGYPAFKWVKGGRTVGVRVFTSERLPNHWRRIDRFEGEMYRRILVPVRLARGGTVFAHIYEGRAPMGVPATL